MIKKKSIIFFTTTIDYGGAEILLLNLAREMVKENTIYIIYYKFEGTLTEKFIEIGITPIKFLNKNPLIFIRNFFMIIQILRINDNQILQGWMYHGSLLASFFKIFNKTNRVFWSLHHSVYGFPKHKFINLQKLKIIGLFSHFTEKIVYVSDFIRLEHEKIGYNKTKSIVIENGIDTNVFIKDFNKRKKIRLSLNIPEGSNVIGIIGRYNFIKDYNTFFSCVSMFISKRSDTHFIIVGRDILIDNFLHFFKQDDIPLLDKYVHIVGEQFDVMAYINAMDIVTLCSISESFSLVLLESFSCEKICVSTKIIFYADQFNKSIKTFNIGDYKSLYQCCLDYINMDLKSKELLGLQARNIVINNYSINNVLKNYYLMWES